MSQSRRVVVTGMGVVSPVGKDLPTFWKNLTSGVSGIGPITHLDVKDYKCRIAGEVRNFNAVKHFKTTTDVNRTDRFTHLAVAAARTAMADAGLTGPIGDPERFGCIIGSGIGGLQTTEEQHTVLMQRGPGRLSPCM